MSSVHWAWIFCVAIFASAPSAGAQGFSDLGLSGSLRGSYWGADKSFRPQRDYAVGAAWLSLRPEEILGARVFVEGYVQGADLGRTGTSFGDVREAFAESSFGELDIKVGRQIVVWGRADKFNPTDSFSTRDLTFLSSDDEDQRLGQFATQLKYNFGSLKLIGLWQSEWRAPTYALRIPPGVTGGFVSERPDHSQNQFGIKVDNSGDTVDWSLSYFDGFNRSPNLKVLSAGPELRLGFDFGRVQVYGADFARNLGDYGVRGELAYTRTEDASGGDPTKQNSTLQGVLGVDRMLIENFNLNLQVLYRHVDDFQDPEAIADPNVRALATSLAVYTNQRFQEQFGITLRPSYKLLNETLEVELAWIAWQRTSDSLLRPKVSYAVSDSLKVIVGGEVYSGPVNSQLGQLKDTSSGYVEVRYLF